MNDRFRLDAAPVPLRQSDIAKRCPFDEMMPGASFRAPGVPAASIAQAARRYFGDGRWFTVQAEFSESGAYVGCRCWRLDPMEQQVNVFPITYDVPIPPRKAARPAKLPQLENLGPGGSFLITFDADEDEKAEIARIGQAVTRANRAHRLKKSPVRFSYRSVEEGEHRGIRVFRDKDGATTGKKGG